MDIPFDRILMTAVAIAIIWASAQLAAWNIAPWNDVFTLFIIILAGAGYGVAGYYAGEARSYKRLLELMQTTVKKETTTA